MKNKLYICEHNVVISPKNQCIDCNYEELRDRMIKGGIFVDDNKQKIEQQSLKRKPKIVSDMLIESLIEQNNELTTVNKQLSKFIDNQTDYYLSSDKNLKNKIDELLLKNKSLEEQNNCSLLTLDSISENYNNLNRLYVELARENNELEQSKKTFLLRKDLLV